MTATEVADREARAFTDRDLANTRLIRDPLSHTCLTRRPGTPILRSHLAGLHKKVLPTIGDRSENRALIAPVATTRVIARPYILTA